MTDVVVIGAGHNGLVAGAYLARAGFEVEVVEAAERVGGMTISGPLIPAAPQHVVHPGAGDVIVMRGTPIIDELELARHGLRMAEPDPTYAYLGTDGEVLPFWRDRERTVAEITRLSAADGRAYAELSAMLEALVAIALPMMRTEILRPEPRELARAARSALRHRQTLGEIASLACVSAEQAIAERFGHPVVKDALMTLAAGAGPTNADGSALSLLLLGLLHAVGIGRPIGGMQKLADALSASARAAGATVRTGAAVDRIIVSRGRASGVRLADGTAIAARAVLATCDPYTTLRRLVPDRELDRRTLARVDAIPCNASGSGPTLINVALSGRAELTRHRHPDVDLRRTVMLYGSTDDVREGFAAARRGELAERPFLWAAITTALDPTQAPDGADVVYLYNVTTPVHPAAGWDAIRGRAENLTMARASEFLGDLERLEQGRHVGTPKDMAAWTRAHNGCITHVDFGLMRFGPLRPALGLGSYRTPVEGLFLGGSGSHPGGSVSGLPGRISSRRVRRYLAKAA
jgi:phytoene dehydrogenase-like protein